MVTLNYVRPVADPISFADNAIAFTVAKDITTKKGEKEVQYFDIVAFDKIANKYKPLIKKGMLLSVSGELSSRVYETKSGTKGKQVSIILSSAMPLAYWTPKKEECDKSLLYADYLVNEEEEDENEITATDIEKLVCPFN